MANYHSKGGRRNNNDSLVNSTTLLHLNGPPPHNTQAFSLLLIVSLLPLSLSLSTTMAEPHSAANPPPPSSSSSAGNRDSAGALPSSSSTLRHGSEDENAGDRSQTGFRSPEVEPSVAYGGGGIGWGFGVETSVAREDAWSCFAVIFTFWFFVSVTMILGVYGSMNLVLGPETSIVFKPSPLFVQYVKVENLKENPGPLLYGTYQYPDLDVATTWEETLNAYVPSDSHQEWKYYLNRGSEVNISYRLSSGSSSIFLVVAEGAEGLTRWLEDPTYPNTTLSWNEIHGTGMITQKIPRSSSYYVALGNLNEEVQVELNLRVRAYLHNTTNAYSKCAVTSSPCSLSIFFPEGNAAILVTPGPQQEVVQNASYDEWYVKLSYGPRWVTYIVGIGGLTLLMCWGFNILNKIQCAREHIAGVRYEGTAPERDPLLSRKDDDLSSWGSSYDSMPQDEEDLDLLTAGSTEGKSLVDGETSNNTRRLCAICFDAPRDCFFLPCGHCAACFECGTRIAEAAGTCPVCRRNMKKVRKIFTV